MMNEPCPQRSGYVSRGSGIKPTTFVSTMNSFVWKPLYKLNSNQARESDTLVKTGELQGHSREDSGTLRGANGIIDTVRHFCKGLF